MSFRNSVFASLSDMPTLCLWCAAICCQQTQQQSQHLNHLRYYQVTNQQRHLCHQCYNSRFPGKPWSAGSPQYLPHNTTQMSVTRQYSIKTTGWIELVLVWRLPSAYLTLCYKEIRPSPKIRALPSGTMSQTLDTENFVRALMVLSTILVNSRACWPHLWQSTHRGWTWA